MVRSDTGWPTAGIFNQFIMWMKFRRGRQYGCFWRLRSEEEWNSVKANPEEQLKRHALSLLPKRALKDYRLVYTVFAPTLHPDDPLTECGYIGWKYVPVPK